MHTHVQEVLLRLRRRRWAAESRVSERSENGRSEECVSLFYIHIYIYIYGLVHFEEKKKKEVVEDERIEEEEEEEEREAK